MNAQEAIAYIHSVSWKGSVPGLRRTRALLEKMGNPERKLQFIHIAGTNGKGSTAAMLASVLHAVRIEVTEHGTARTVAIRRDGDVVRLHI